MLDDNPFQNPNNILKQGQAIITDTGPLSDVHKTLAERGARYGEFPEHASISQCLKSVMRTGGAWQKLAADQKEALEMVAHKIARILNGDPDYDDSWRDCIGYLQLVLNRLLKEKK